jgi:AmiR/NasT family two-component response regulator
VPSPEERVEAALERSGHPRELEVARLNGLVGQLETALEHRGVIERAKGILMVTRRCSADEAFNLLRRQSQHENVKLRLIAERVVDSVEQSVGAPSK